MNVYLAISTASSNIQYSFIFICLFIYEFLLLPAWRRESFGIPLGCGPQKSAKVSAARRQAATRSARSVSSRLVCVHWLCALLFSTKYFLIIFFYFYSMIFLELTQKKNYFAFNIFTSNSS